MPPEDWLLLAVISGSRSVENAESVVAEVKQQLSSQPPQPMTSDEAPAYKV